MRKPTMIIGKKQIALAGLTLMLGVVVYANYALSSKSGEIKTTDKVETRSVNYGDAQLVNGEPTEDYFAQARIDKMKSRDEAVQTLQLIMTGGDATEEEKQTASEQASTVSGLIESESKIESLIKAAGFEDCVVYLDMPIDVSQRLMTRRYAGDEGKKDIHEANVAYLTACRTAALYAADKLGWHVLRCAADGLPLPIDAIAQTVWQIVSKEFVTE